MAGRDAGHGRIPGKAPLSTRHHGKRPAGAGTKTVGKTTAVAAGTPKSAPQSRSTYERFLADDPRGNIIANSTKEDMTRAVLALYSRPPSPGERKELEFPVVIENPIDVDGTIEFYPKPLLPKWKHLIGDHQIRLKGRAKVDPDRAPPSIHVVMTMTVTPLGHSRFARCKVKTEFDITTYDIDLDPSNPPVDWQT